MEMADFQPSAALVLLSKYVCSKYTVYTVQGVPYQSVEITNAMLIFRNFVF